MSNPKRHFDISLFWPPRWTTSRGGAEDGNRSARSIFMDDFRDVPFDSGDRIGVVDRDENYRVLRNRRLLRSASAKTQASDAQNTFEADPRPRERARVGARVFAHTSEYPNEMPRLKCRSVRNINEKDLPAVTGDGAPRKRDESSGAPTDLRHVRRTHVKERLRRRTRITTEHDDDDDLLRGRCGREGEETAGDSRRKGADESDPRTTGTPVTTEARPSRKSGEERSNVREAMATARRCQKKLWAKEARHVRKRNKGSFHVRRRFFEERYAGVHRSGRRRRRRVEKTVKTLPSDDDTFPKVWKTRRKTRMSRAIQ